MSDKQKSKLTKKEKKAMNHAKLMAGKNRSEASESENAGNSRA